MFVRLAVMSEDSSEKSVTVIPLAPPPKAQTADAVVEEAGRAIVAMLQKASEVAKEDCDRAMDTVHRISYQLHRAEERAREAEAELAHFRERATRAEAWLLRIHNEAEQVFFRKNEQEPGPAPIAGIDHAASVRDSRPRGRPDATRMRAPQPK